MAAGEIRVGNSILPNLTIAAASSADDDAPQDDDVLIFQDNEMDKMDANLNSSLTMTSCFNNDQRVIRPSLSKNIHRTDNMSDLLSKMSTSENFVVMEDYEQVADLNRLEEPSILAIEDVVRWGIKYNQTAFALKKLRPQAMFMVGVNELSTELILNYFKGLEPTEIEWIDDNSCNLVWNTADDCIRALLKISREQENCVVPVLAEKSITPEDFLKDSEKSEQELKDKKAMPAPSVLKIPSKEPKNRDYNNVLRDCIIPLYASGKKYNLEVRLAVMSDKKMRGSQHKSRYYQRHGNPNYKNMTGLISGTMRNRMDSQRMEEDKKHFGITPILPQQNGITSRLGRKAPQYDDMDDLMGGDDEHGLMNTRASDLNDVISNDAPPLPPVKIEDKGPDDQEGFGTMVADREQKVSQHKSHVSNLSQVFGKKTGVHSRLGHKEEPTGLVISVTNMNSDSSSSSESSSSSNSSDDMTYEIDVRKTKKKSSKSKRDKKSSRRDYEKDDYEEDKYSSRKTKTKKESRSRDSEKIKSRDYDREERKYSEDKYSEDRKYREARSREDERRTDRRRDERSREERHREHRDPRDDRYRDDRVRDDRVRDDRVRDDRVRDERVSDRHHQDRHRDPRDDRNREDRHRDERHRDSRDDRNRDERYQTSSRRDRSRSPVRSSRRDTEKSSGWDNKDYREYNENRTYTRKEEKHEKSASPKRKHRGATPPSSSSSSNDSSSSDSESSSSSSNDSDSSSSSSDDDDESMTVTMTVPSVNKSPSRAY